MFKNLRQYEVFLRWWLLFAVMFFGIGILYFNDVLQKVAAADFTKISFIIYGIFLIFTARAGYFTYLICKYPNKKEEICRRIENGWFFSDQMVTLGMVGTVIGFIFMLGTNFANVSIESGNANKMLVMMMTGASTALYTTASGLICSFLLKLQLFNLAQHLDACPDVSCAVVGDKDEKDIL